MTKIALVQPRIKSGKSLGIVKSPKSIQALAGELEREGYIVRMFDEEAEEALYAKLAEFHPDYVGISTMTANFLEGKKVAEAVKAIQPKTPVILGGWHASGVVQAYLKGQEEETIREILYSGSPFDLVVAGEGEIVLSEIVKKLDNHQPVRGLKGVGYLEKDGTLQVSNAERIRNLDALADPSWQGLPIDDYRDKRSNALDLSVHFNRACRFACAYCSTSSVYGRGVETVSAERAADTIESILKQFNPQTITFTDEDFFANPQWVKEIVRIFTERNLTEKYGVSFDTFASINDILRMKERGQGEFLESMAKAGFGSFTIGIESLNPEILEVYNKELMIVPTMTAEQKKSYRQSTSEEKKTMLGEQYLKCAQQAIDFAQQHGILVVGDYIVGNPKETEEQVRAGFERFKSLKNLYIAYIPVFTPFPGTKLWEEAYNSGKIIRTAEGRIDWSRFNASTGSLELGYDVEALRNQLEVEFYTSEKYLRDMRAMIEKNPTSATLFQNRFNYLNRIMPGNHSVKAALRELG